VLRIFRPEGRRLSLPVSNANCRYLKRGGKIKFYSLPKKHGKGFALGEKYDEVLSLQQGKVAHSKPTT